MPSHFSDLKTMHLPGLESLRTRTYIFFMNFVHDYSARNINTLLAQASSRGDVDTARRAILFGADPNHELGSAIGSDYSLLRAIHSTRPTLDTRYVSIIQLILNNGDYTTVQGKQQIKRALALLVRNHRINYLPIMLEHAAVQGHSDPNLLHTVAIENASTLEMLEFFEQQGVIFSDADLRNVLKRCAEEEGIHRVYRMITCLEQRGVEVNLNELNLNELMRCSLQGDNMEMASWLREKGGVDVDANTLNQALIDAVRHTGQVATINWLCENGADVNTVHRSQGGFFSGPYEYTPLMWATYGGSGWSENPDGSWDWRNYAAYRARPEDIIDILIRHGADIDQSTMSGTAASSTSYSHITRDSMRATSSRYGAERGRAVSREITKGGHELIAHIINGYLGGTVAFMHSFKSYAQELPTQFSSDDSENENKEEKKDHRNRLERG